MNDKKESLACQTAAGPRSVLLANRYATSQSRSSAAHSMKHALRRASSTPAPLTVSFLVTATRLVHAEYSACSRDVSRCSRLCAGDDSAAPVRLRHGVHQPGHGQDSAGTGRPDARWRRRIDVDRTILIPGAIAGRDFSRSTSRKCAPRSSARPLQAGRQRSGADAADLGHEVGLHVRHRAKVADTYDISREAADEYALRSQELANRPSSLVVSTSKSTRSRFPGRGFFARDEHPRARATKSWQRCSRFCAPLSHCRQQLWYQ